MDDKPVWSFEALKEYLDMRIDELEKSIDRRFAGQYSISGRLMYVLTGLGVLVATVAAIVKWHL